MTVLPSFTPLFLAQLPDAPTLGNTSWLSSRFSLDCFPAQKAIFQEVIVRLYKLAADADSDFLCQKVSQGVLSMRACINK